MPIEAARPACERIKVRRLRVRVAIAPQAVIALLIGQDQDNVWRLARI
jgi:hypothetical protein